MRIFFIFLHLFIVCNLLSAQTSTSAFCKAILAERNKLLKTADSLPYTYTFSRFIQNANRPYQKGDLLYKGVNLLDSLSKIEEFYVLDLVMDSNRLFLTFIYSPQYDTAYTYSLKPTQTIEKVEVKQCTHHSYAEYINRANPDYSLNMPALLLTKIKKTGDNQWQISCNLRPTLIPTYDNLTLQRMKIALEYMQTFLGTLDTNWAPELKHTRLYKYRTLPFTPIEVKPRVQFLIQKVYAEEIHNDCKLENKIAVGLEKTYQNLPDKYQAYVPALIALSPNISSLYELYFEMPVKNRIACLLLYNGLRQEIYEDVAYGNTAIGLQFFFDEGLNIICVTKTVIQFG
ncbi:MAG: hypothetical protein ACKVTZ_05850 [Bacteroidia bacterium]